MDRDILRIALPAIVANITVPLLGLIDMAIAGHLGDTAFIGAMSVGAMMFNMIYWNFAFLRMGTSGLTAQAYGRGNHIEARQVLLRAVALASIIAALILVLQYPLQWVALTVIGPSPDVLDLATRYFFVVVWGAPAILIMLAVKGWFLGMQDSQSAMRISICVDVANIVASLVAVYVLKLGFIGIAIGTVIAEYFGLAYSGYLLAKKHGELLSGIKRSDLLHLGDLKRFMSVNTDIFFRSFCLMTVTLCFIAIGARSGDLILAVNSLIMQLYILFSYFMDGIAFAGEALVGKYMGAADHRRRRKCVAHLFGWGGVIMLIYAIAYGVLPREIFSLLTDDRSVVEAAVGYRWWCMAIPVASVAAFVWDGVFIGQTDSRGMLITVAAASALFYVTYFALSVPEGNNRLWLAYIVYLAVRSVVQTAIWFYKEWQISRRKTVKILKTE